MLIKRLKILALTVGEQGVSSLVLFAVNIILARSTTKDEFGFYVLGMSILMTFIGFQRAFITTPYTIQLNNEDSNECLKYNVSLKNFNNLLSILFVLISLPVIVYFLYRGDIYYAVMLISFVLFFLGQSLLYFYKFFLIANNYSYLNFIYSVSIHLTTFFLIGVMYFFNSISIVNVYLFFGISCFISTFFLGCKLYQGYEKKHFLYGVKWCVCKNWKVGRWLMASNIAFIFSSQIFPWFLLFFYGSDSVAEYGVVMSVTRILAPLTQGLSSYLLPRLRVFTDNLKAFKAELLLFLFFMLAISLLLIVFGVLFGVDVVKIIYGDKYKIISLPIILSFILQSTYLMNMPIDAALNALKRTDIGFISLLISAVISLILGSTATMNYGMVGALYTLIITSVVAIAYRCFVLKRIIMVK